MRKFVLGNRVDLVLELKKSGIEQTQAEAIVGAIVKAQDNLATKQDIEIMLQKELSPIKTELAVNKWMLGFSGAASMALLLKTFF